MRRVIVCLVALLVVGLTMGADWTNSGVQSRGPTTLQNAAASGNGTVLNSNATVKEHVFYATWGAGTTAGSVIIETAASSDYSGTWATLTTVSWATASTTAIYKYTGCLAYVRARIGTRVAASTAKTITGVTQANPGVVTSASHGFTNGDVVYIDGVVGMTELNGNTYTVANADTNTFELSGVDTTGYTAYTSGGTATKDGAVTVKVWGTN